MRKQNISKRLKTLRLKAGLNQSQLARSVGVTRAAASRWEQGDIESILARNAIRLADILDTNVEYLFTGRSPNSKIDIEAFTKSIRLVDQVLTDLDPKNKAAITALTYQLMSSGRSVSKKLVRQLEAAA